jgi:hypothetical protein
MENDPNILILMYQLGREIITIKDHFENLEPKITELEKMGIECSLIPLDREHEIQAIFAKYGATKTLPN